MMPIVIGSIPTPGTPLAGVLRIDRNDLEPHGFGLIPDELFQLSEGSLSRTFFNRKEEHASPYWLQAGSSHVLISMVKARKQQQVALLDRRRKIAVLYLRHIDQVTIAQQLGVTQATVSRDLKALTQRWLAESVEAVSTVKARELAELDDIERECAMQFYIEKDPAWLDRRFKCKERRAKLLGLDAPAKTALTDPTGEHEAGFLALTEEEQFLRIMTILERAQRRREGEHA
jgi:hypothetical protein